MSQRSSAGASAQQQVAALTQKLYDPDPDIRYMSLFDLTQLFKTNSAAFLAQDYHQCAKIIDGFLHTLNDTNGEVQNMTITSLGPFSLKCNPEILAPYIYKIGTANLDNAVDISIVPMALRTIVVSLPRPHSGQPRTKPEQDAYSAISRVLIPRLVGYLVVQKPDPKLPPVPKGLLQEDLEKGGDGNSIEVLSEVANCFGPMLQQTEIKALQRITMELLESERSSSVLKKRAVAAIGALSKFFSDALLSSVLSPLMEKMRDVHASPANQKLYYNLLGSIAKSIPAKFGPHLKQIAPFVISGLSQDIDEPMSDTEEDTRDTSRDEAREAAIVALEAFYTSCPDNMQLYNKESMDGLLRCLRYDPNLAMHEDGDFDAGDTDDAEFEGDEDFEQEDIADDDDDVSWKVRKCSARALQAVLAVRSKDFLDNAESFDRISKTLLECFKEREEAVRTDVVSTTSYLVRKSKFEDHEFDGLSHALEVERSASQTAGSRKRRRGDSSTTAVDDTSKFRRLTGSLSPAGQNSPHQLGAPANLARLASDIQKSALKLAIHSSPATKLVSVTLLRELISQVGGAEQTLGELFALIDTNISSPAGVGVHLSPAASTSLHVESLQLLNEIAKTTSSKSLQPYLTQIIPKLENIAQSKLTQLSCEALRSSEQVVKALTPPRSGSTLSKSSAALANILSMLQNIVSKKASDLMVRQQAISVLGTLVGRTLDKDGSTLLTKGQRQASLQLLLDVCQNETTRLAAIRALDVVAIQAPQAVVLPEDWFTAACIELGNQLRKQVRTAILLLAMLLLARTAVEVAHPGRKSHFSYQDRSLRGASLQALRSFIVNRRCTPSITNPKKIADLLIPQLTSDDLQILGPSILILAYLIRDSKADVMAGDLISSICELLKNGPSSDVVDELSVFMDCIGQRRVGKSLMQHLLKDVGLSGNATVLGKIIGDLLTSSGPSAGINIDAFLNELQTNEDERRKCLALSVIGEFGLRSGASSGLKPDLFVKYLDHKNPSSEVPLAAAIALGRAAAGAGNTKLFAPVIISRVNSRGRQNVAIYGIKELLQYSEDTAELVPFMRSMWEAAVSAAKEDQASPIGAVCIAKIAELEPESYLQALQALLSDPEELVRRLGIHSLRSLFTNTDLIFSKFLRPIFVSAVDNTLRDSSPENRRIALNTFSAAIRSKPELALPNLAQLLPAILDQSVEDPSLVREVSIGPFKQKVDDGLETRKSAYETIFSLFEQSPQSTSSLLSQLTPRIIAGLADDETIRTLSVHMLLRIVEINPGEVARYLNDIAEKCEKVLSVKLKETAVRTQVEKDEEAKRSIVKLTVQLQRKIVSSAPKQGVPSGAAGAQGATSTRWQAYVEDMRSTQANSVREEEKELNEGGP